MSGAAPYRLPAHLQMDHPPEDGPALALQVMLLTCEIAQLRLRIAAVSTALRAMADCLDIPPADLGFPSN